MPVTNAAVSSLGQRASRLLRTVPTGGTGRLSVRRSPVHFPFFAARRSRLDFGLRPFVGRSDANPPAFGAMPQHLPVVEYFIPFRL